MNRWLNEYRENDIINNNYHQSETKNTVINDPKCGNRPTANRRVIDGSDAGFGTFPWQALVQIGKAKCGGVLGNYLDFYISFLLFMLQGVSILHTAIHYMSSLILPRLIGCA